MHQYTPKNKKDTRAHRDTYCHTVAQKDTEEPIRKHIDIKSAEIYSRNTWTDIQRHTWILNNIHKHILIYIDTNTLILAHGHTNTKAHKT